MHFIEIDDSSISDDQQFIAGETETLLDEDNADSNMRNNDFLKNPRVNTIDISSASISVATPIQNKKLIDAVERKDRTHWQLDKLIPIWLILFLLIMQSMIKDSKIFGVTKCSAVYWIVYAAYISKIKNRV